MRGEVARDGRVGPLQEEQSLRVRFIPKTRPGNAQRRTGGVYSPGGAAFWALGSPAALILTKHKFNPPSER
jgi:hypothetical protein